MNTIFPNYFYFKYKAPNYKEIITVLEKETSKVNNLDFTWGDLCEVDKISLDSNKYIQYLTPSLELLCNDLKCNIEFNIKSSWMNLYKRDYYQELHMHVPDELVCVFFMNDGNDFSKFYFYDRNTDIPFVWTKILNLKLRHFIEYNQGDIIFFPAHLLHGVSKHKSDIIRKTFSCNFTMNVI